MAVNFDTVVYGPCQTLFGRPITVDPIASQPKMPEKYTYAARGIYDTRTLNVDLEDGSILSDQDTILDIRESEFPIPPEQGDQIDIDEDPASLLPRLGLFEVTNVWNNGGGEITLQLRKIGP